MEEIAAKIQAKNAELDIAIGNVEFAEKTYNKAVEIADAIRREINILYKELNVYLGAKNRF